jgi:signal transduction histidine kinase
LSDTSHELRRPLTLLRTDLDVLRDPKLPKEERAIVEEEMKLAAESMSTLVTELLVLARSDEMNLRQEPVNLSDVCRAAVATARQTAPKHRFEAAIDSDLWVTGDEAALSRAVGNIVQNAAVYSEPGTQIKVCLAKEDAEIRLHVVDHGPGMSPDDVAHAFERFYRGGNGRNSRPEGLGLGLAIVKQIIEAHQGRIAIQSETGRGTTVAIELPAI